MRCKITNLVPYGASNLYALKPELDHRVIILNRGSMFAFQWREFSPPLSSAHRLLTWQKRDRRRCNSRETQNTYFFLTPPLLTRATTQWARSLEWRQAVTLQILVGKICINFFLFYCEGMLSLVVLWLCELRWPPYYMYSDVYVDFGQNIWSFRWISVGTQT